MKINSEFSYNLLDNGRLNSNEVDINTPSNKLGFKCYNKFLGFFANIFGIAVKLQSVDQKIYYVNKQSILKWERILGGRPYTFLKLDIYLGIAKELQILHKNLNECYNTLNLLYLASAYYTYDNFTKSSKLFAEAILTGSTYRMSDDWREFSSTDSPTSLPSNIEEIKAAFYQNVENDMRWQLNNASTPMQLYNIALDYKDYNMYPESIKYYFKAAGIPETLQNVLAPCNGVSIKKFSNALLATTNIELDSIKKDCRDKGIYLPPNLDDIRRLFYEKSNMDN